MSPRHDWYPLAVTIAVSIASSILAVVLCLIVQSRADTREREQREQLARQSAASHVALCSVIESLDDNAADVKATTPLGARNARTYAELRVSQNCSPRVEN